MENASKALIIAGAILLSILIIALGIFIFNQAKGAINTNTLDSTEIATFNDPITQYTGDSVMGSSVKNLVTKLASDASTNKGAGDRLPKVTLVPLNGTNVEAAGQDTAAADDEALAEYVTQLQDINKAISNRHYYAVEYTLNDAGLVGTITIYYDTNTWNFTKLGKIEDVSQKELIDILGDGDVVVTFSLNDN